MSESNYACFRVRPDPVDGPKRFQPIIQAAKARDAWESDTVTIITDYLTEIFGYDKYSEVTSEHEIRGTFVDLAIKVNDTLLFLIEAKAIGLILNDKHLKQAVDYAANKGVDWVVPTNGQNQLVTITFNRRSTLRSRQGKLSTKNVSGKLFNLTETMCEVVIFVKIPPIKEPKRYKERYRKNIPFCCGLS